MNQKIRFGDLETYQQWAFIGNLLLIGGSVAISVSTLLRMTSSGTLTDQPAFPPTGAAGLNGTANSGAPTTGLNRARNFFS